MGSVFIPGLAIFLTFALIAAGFMLGGLTAGLFMKDDEKPKAALVASVDKLQKLESYKEYVTQPEFKQFVENNRDRYERIKNDEASLLAFIKEAQENKL